MLELFDLPAHPMFVHAPVVLMPLTAVAALLFNVRDVWRRRYAPHVLGAVVVLMVTLQMAMSSGEAFDEALAGQVDVSRHEDLANVTRLFVLLMLLATVALFVVVRRGRAPKADAAAGSAAASSVVERGIGVAIAILGVLGTIWMIRTGHEGASVVWSGTLK